MAFIPREEPSVLGLQSRSILVSSFRRPRRIAKGCAPIAIERVMCKKEGQALNCLIACPSVKELYIEQTIRNSARLTLRFGGPKLILNQSLTDRSRPLQRGSPGQACWALS